MLKFLKHILLWVIALSIINTSIDIPESRLNSLASDGSLDEAYDEIESIAEFVLDEATDKTLPDQSGNDEQGVLKKSVAFDFSLPEKKERNLTAYFHSNSIELTGEQDKDDLPAGHTTIFTPPPDLV
ncbi:MAG: hypothetical protein DI535_20275 [Citrobacter freundii]|nr:MAG: hypothetical protein DI535_20275 [Citrobacter freundii]